MTTISVVIPLYRCSDALCELNDRLLNTLTNITDEFEIIYVNDASPENDWEIVSKLSKNDNRIKGINFSRNFGQHYAITAGLNYARGEWIIVMDGDLQDQPEEVKKLYSKILDGYDVVFARRVKRKDKFFKRLSSNVFYFLYNYLTNKKFDNTVANFSISKKQVIDEFIKFTEKDRSFPLLIHWLGFNIGYVDVKHDSSSRGKSSYSLKKLLKFALSSIISQSNKPLKISIAVGFFFSGISFLFAIFIIYKKIALGIPVTGWASLITSTFFIGGLTIMNIGIVGIYIGRIFDQSKGRALYIIKNKIGL